ncbi:MAG: NAD-dependent epimerase/dehydratase family protein [Anaerolineales bacterium]|nr:NAD-dependent epimerase/dehydratase family protein [Anaerolineales bacterium]
MRRSLVTGGAGFIGSAIVEALVRRGDRVRVLDNFSTGKRSNLAAAGDEIEIIDGDLRDPDAVRRALQDIEIVFHEAAFVSVPQSMVEPELCDEINVHGTVRILAAAQRAGVRRVILASSAAVYGDSDALPLNEREALNPLSPYAVSKRVNELYAKLYGQVFGLETVCLRYFNVYGPRQSPESDYAAAIPIFLRKMIARETPSIYGDGRQGRDFVFIQDVVGANLKAAESPAAAGQVFNVCSGKEVQIIDLVTTINRVLGQDIQPLYEAPRSGDIYRSLGDPSQAEAVFNFTAATDLETGLAQTAAWMQGG